MKNICINIIKYTIYATFFVPLILMKDNFIFPFIVPKIVIFRSLVELALAGYILLLFLDWEQYRPRFSSTGWALFIFLISFALSTVFGVDAYHSFWDNHERMLGLFTIFHYFIFFIICISVFKTWTDWQNALRWFLVAGTLVILLGIFQIFDPYFLLNQGGARIASTLGNPIYISGYGLFLFFVSALLFIKEKNSVWRGVYIVAGLLALIGLLYGGARGVMLGLLVGIGAGLLFYSLIFKENKKIRYTLFVFLLVGILSVGFLYAFRSNSTITKIPGLSRALGSSFTELVSGPRGIAWKIAIEGWKTRPFFGWGPNNFFYAFNLHYNPQSLEFGYGETWFDNAHNIILNTLTVQGIFGLLSYLSIFAFSFWVLFTSYKRGILEKNFVVISSAFLVAHLVQNITVFENPTSYLYFFFWLAMVDGLATHKQLDVNISNQAVSPLIVPEPEKTLQPIIIVPVIFSVICAVYFFNIQPALANMTTMTSLQNMYSDPALGLSSAEKALTVSSPHIDDIRADVARAAIQTINSGYSKIGPNISGEILALVGNDLKMNVELHPMDIRNQMTLAQIAQMQYLITRNGNYIVEAEKFLEDAATYSPRRQQISYNLSTLKLQLGKVEEAKRLIEKTINDNPKIGEGYWRLAYIYQAIGDSKKSAELIALGRTKTSYTAADENSITEIMKMAQPAKQPVKK